MNERSSTLSSLGGGDRGLRGRASAGLHLAVEGRELTCVVDMEVALAR
jgi:hypothetical protein